MLTLFFDPKAFPTEDAAVLIGDVLHNLRSALDILWNDVIVECGGAPTKWSRFPVRDTADELIAPLANLLKQKQIEIEVQRLLLDHIKPYEAGNYSIWALDDLNIRDKHQLLIPVLKIMHIRGVCFEDECGKEWPLERLLMADTLWTLPLPEFYRKDIRVKNKGHATTGVFFNHGLPYAGAPVVPTLDRITKEVLRTVEAFSTLLFGETG